MVINSDMRRLASERGGWMKRETTDVWDLDDEDLRKVDLAMDSIIRALGRRPIQPRRTLQQRTSSRRYEPLHFRIALRELSKGGYVWTDKEGAFMLSDKTHDPRVIPCPVCGR